MVIVIGLAAMIAATPAPVGVVRGGEAVRPAAGLLRAGDRIQTGKNGWAEVHILGRGRVRLYPQSQIEIRPGPALRLVGGRIWMQAHGATELDVRGGLGRIESGTSVILEDTQGGGLVVAVLAGAASVGSVKIGPQRVWRRPVLGPATPPRRGGRELANLVREQTRLQIGDWSGLEMWLQRELATTTVGPPKGLSPGGVVRSEQEAADGESSVVAESALRPPPFFEREVPSRGPNVRVEIEFTDD